MQWTQVQSLVEELRFHMLHSTAKGEKKTTLLPDDKIYLNKGKSLELGVSGKGGLLTPAEAASPPEPFWRTMQEYIPNALKIHRPTAPAILLLDKSYNKHGLHVFSEA